MNRIRELGRRFKREIQVYRRVLADQRTPPRTRWLLRAAVAYALSPIDLIPDFIPVVGHLDDPIILPFPVWLALRSMPPNLLAEHRAHIEGKEVSNQSLWGALGSRLKGVLPKPNPTSTRSATASEMGVSYCGRGR